MSEQDFQGQVIEGYRKINHKWLRVHFLLLLYLTLISSAVESMMFFIIQKSGTLNCPPGEYWFKYVLVPVVFNAAIVASGYILIKQKKLSAVAKQYCISLLFLALAFVLELMHSGFVAVLVAAIFPVLMTIMYENQTLTAVVALCAAASQAISGYFMFWDPEKVVNSAYLINLITLLVATGCTWLACRFMIGFMRMKREIILHNDMERVRLQREINIDGLTEVGNKLALLARLDAEESEAQRVSYLVMLDMDDFKKINDTYGHLFGDDVLRCLGKALRDVRSAEAFRYGGDEFCMVFTQDSLADVRQEIKNIQETLQRGIQTPDANMAICISVGIARNEKGKTTETLLRQADAALYAAKAERRNGIAVYKP